MKVQCYWNLHKKCWSIRSKESRLVIAHRSSLHLTDVKFRVSESGRQRVIREQRKNIHAFVEGDWWFFGDTPVPPCPHRVSYNPYKRGEFVRVDSEEAVHSASVVHLDCAGKAWVSE